MTHPLFISYRRDDSADAAQAIFAQLRLQFGLASVFMDVNTVQSGELWPDRIRLALERARAVLVVIGDMWLFARDEFGRRKLDDPDDWVQLEIATALRDGKRIYPILVGAKAAVPPLQALPEAIGGLSSSQATMLRRENWIGDLSHLVQVLDRDDVTRGLTLATPKPQPNAAKVRRYPALTEEDLAKALATLPDWEPWSEILPSEYPYVRQELRRNILFKDFRSAMTFMTVAAELFRKEKHHPRWGNEWRTVTVRLTTWDAGNRITARDVEVAALVDKLVRDHKAAAAPAPTPGAEQG